MGIHAAIVDEHELTRIAIEEILNRAPDIDFAGSFVNVEPLLEADRTVDVLLLGYNQNQPEFADVMDRLKRTYPDIRVIMLGRQWTEASVHIVLDCGADGAVDRDEALHDLLAAGVRRVQHGKRFLSPEVAALTYASTGNNEQLTERELDVVLLMNDAANTNEMAAALGVSRRTVNRLQTNICDKWNLRSRDQIVVEAVKRGIIRIRD